MTPPKKAKWGYDKLKIKVKDEFAWRIYKHKSEFQYPDTYVLKDLERLKQLLEQYVLKC